MLTLLKYTLGLNHLVSVLWVFIPKDTFSFHLGYYL